PGAQAPGLALGTHAADRARPRRPALAGAGGGDLVGRGDRHPRRRRRPAGARARAPAGRGATAPRRLPPHDQRLRAGRDPAAVAIAAGAPPVADALAVAGTVARAIPRPADPRGSVASVMIPT